MTAAQKRLIAAALVVADRWTAMLRRPDMNATRTDARALLELAKAAKAYKREQRGAAR